MILLAIIAIGIWQKNELLHLIKEGGILAVFVSMLMVAICVFFPVIPFTVLGGVIGAVFGIGQGVIISLTGAMFGTMIFFFLCRYGFRDFAQGKIRNFTKVREYEELLERNSFFVILACRLIPVIPAPVFNSVCALSNVKWYTFFFASVIGKIPNILILSYAGASFKESKLFSLGIYGVYMLIIFLVSFVVIYVNARRKTMD
ncbi:TVP38/TMEM64 family protein [Neobacillus endophyticus]|uniref:TVP38/TMEM64 family protein n=1 Tax=Neobacillus endophyticus TaxID=2738405 RepID=UPI001FE25D39|nr:TVP38/TMEM64 family protein [Neobacillus endophyticus]